MLTVTATCRAIEAVVQPKSTTDMVIHLVKPSAGVHHIRTTTYSRSINKRDVLVRCECGWATALQQTCVDNSLTFELRRDSGPALFDQVFQGNAQYLSAFLASTLLGAHDEGDPLARTQHSALSALFAQTESA